MVTTTVEPEPRSLSIRVQLATVLIVTVVLVGALFAWLGYRQSSAILWSASEQVFARVADQVVARLRETYGPVRGTVDLLSRSDLMDATSMEERLEGLPVLVEGLRSSPEMSALYAGYPDGSFLIIRPLTSPAVREGMEAPDGAAYSVNHSGPHTGEARASTRLFLDEALNEIDRRTQPSSFDPRRRPWFEQAIGSDSSIRTAPYVYYTTREIGVTVARRAGAAGSVVAADVTLGQLASTLAQAEVTPSAEIVVFDRDLRALGYRDPARLVVDGGEDGVTMARLDQLGVDVFSAIAGSVGPEAGTRSFEHQGQAWYETVRPIAIRDEGGAWIAMVAPESELLAEASGLIKDANLTALVLIVLLIPAAWLMSGFIARPLQELAAATRRIRRFEFSRDAPVRSHVREIDDLADAMKAMERTIVRFLDLIGGLSREQAFEPLLGRVVAESMQVCASGTGALYLLGEEDTELVPVSAQRAGGDGAAFLSSLAAVAVGHAGGPLGAVARTGRVETLVRKRDAGSTDSALRPYFDALDGDSLRFILVPLHDRKDKVMGVLCLADASATDARGESDERIGFIRALSGFASVSVESQRLLKIEKELLEAFIKLIAGAIDAKSPYTGGHCQRVPALTMMLAQAAARSEEPAFAGFELDEQAWEALHIASWLHDCGKVTTPEYVVDKSTKLETIYDRVHEVRMRFEVLKRDAEIRGWQAIADGAGREESLAALRSEHATLDEEFAFVAECNEGGEFMAPERMEKLERIAARTWHRTLDDRIGISWEERKRKEREPAPALPAEERLLADKDEHLIHRSQAESLAEYDRYGFRLDPPEHLYNRGEVYNLRVARGTLTEEERFKINDHIVQTIVMLRKLPFPRHLRDVPDIAGGHHEKMDGTGYPRCLKREDMPLTARMMAIADIFEALTAADRPYKKAKTLSEAIRIMSFMKKDAHIDPDLFGLFLRSGVYVQYAQQFLAPEQIDEVDVQQHV